MGELVPADKPFDYELTRLVINGSPSYEQFVEFGNTLIAIDTARQWWIGDFLNAFEQSYNEEWSNIVSETEFSSF